MTIQLYTANTVLHNQELKKYKLMTPRFRYKDFSFVNNTLE